MTSNAEPCTITYEGRDGYLYARVSGERDTAATSLRYWNEIGAECRRADHRYVLVVENFRTSAPLADVFKVAEQLPAIVRGITVAFVDERVDDAEANKFAEDVAVNRGAFGRVFSDEARADEWLRRLRESEPRSPRPAG